MNRKLTAGSSVDDYIANTPREVQGRLREIRSAIREATPGATERTDYFQMPGYSYEGYDYDGMFVWLNFKKHIYDYIYGLQVIEDHKNKLAGCVTTKAIVSFPSDKKLSMALVKKHVKASLREMKNRSK